MLSTWACQGTGALSGYIFLPLKQEIEAYIQLCGALPPHRNSCCFTPTTGFIRALTAVACVISRGSSISGVGGGSNVEIGISNGKLDARATTVQAVRAVHSVVKIAENNHVSNLLCRAN